MKTNNSTTTTQKSQPKLQLKVFIKFHTISSLIFIKNLIRTYDIRY